MATKRKSILFRVTGLPSNETDIRLATRLRSVIEENLQKEEIIRITTKVALVPPCRIDEKTLIALVEFSEIPQFLSGLVENPLGDWQVEMDDTDISFDLHLFGFTQLYATEPGNAVIAE
jgi:hypothetical protein